MQKSRVQWEHDRAGLIELPSLQLQLEESTPCHGFQASSISTTLKETAYTSSMSCDENINSSWDSSVMMSCIELPDGVRI